MRGGFPESLTNVPQKIAVLRRDDSSNLAFHRQKSKFTKKDWRERGHCLRCQAAFVLGRHRFNVQFWRELN